jgi:hypothetical protein
VALVTLLAMLMLGSVSAFAATPDTDLPREKQDYHDHRSGDDRDQQDQKDASLESCAGDYATSIPRSEATLAAQVALKGNFPINDGPPGPSEDDGATEARRFNIFDAFPTRWDPGDYSPSSKVACETIVAKMGRVELG